MTEAESLFRRSQILLEDAYPKGHPRMGHLLKAYVLQMRATGRPDLAAELEAQVKKS